MFSQLFGKYLVEKGVIGYADYREAVEKQLNVRVKLGTIAVAEGLLTVEQAETINKLQKQFDKRFGDIAVEKKYLTEEQVEALLKKQGNPYMQFLEVLLDSEKASISEIETEFAAFQKENGFSRADMDALKHDDFEKLVPIYAFSSKPFVTDIVCLMLRNINRFVSRDFYMDKIEHVKEMSYTCLAGQKSYGDYTIQLALAGEKTSEGFLKIASAFAGEDYATTEEDALDAVCEFINCTSGLFAAEQSKKDVELDMQPVYAYENQKLIGDVYVLPIYIEDCEVKLVIGIDSEVEMGQSSHKFSYEKVESSVAIGLAKGTVAVVDDSKMSRKILRNILEEAGYAVIAEATDGEEGIAVYMQYKPDILTLDITMPNMDGIEALREIMSVDKKARIIMISAAGQQQKIIEALKIGAEKFITKPFEPNDVIANIDGMLKK
ncbi:MAG: response regulator [Agathobacter sp.]|nr:response regulator [Agathobacter sp.]